MGEFVNLGSFVMQLINMCIIIYILNRFLFKPYLAYIREEEKKRKEVDFAYSNLDSIKIEAKREAEKIIEEAKTIGVAEKEKIEQYAYQKRDMILQEAEKESKEIINSANKEIQKMELSMLQSVKANVLDLALKLNSKIFGKEVVNKDFLERELETLAK